MSITQEQINIFNEHPFPPNINLSPADGFVGLLRGKEALITKAKDNEGRDWAFKWYASLSGKSVKELVKYADGINQDEKSLRNLGLTYDQIPNSDFLVSQNTNSTEPIPELYAIQPWTEGVPLRELSIKEIVQNRRLRRNLGTFFINCGRLYDKEGIMPDLTGGKRLNLFGHDVVDPTGFIWPFRTTNIIIQNDTPILIDAKHNTEVQPLKRLAIHIHRRISQLTGRMLTRI